MENLTPETADIPAQKTDSETTGRRTIETGHIDVLDGIRALAVLGVLWFHFWQQNWIMPYLRLPFLKALGLPTTISLDFLPRAGFLFVDLMLFLSAFCLFLPYARAALDKTALPETRVFFKKRIARIVPSYYFSVLVILFAVSIPSGAYRSLQDCLGDLIPTLTFTQTLFPNILLGTKLNGVLWTAAIEMQFYLFFPLLARWFTKKPVWTYLGMVAISLLYLRGFALNNVDSIRTTVNQLPAFFGVFANGMAFSYLFALLARHAKRSVQMSALALCGLITGIWLLTGMLKAAPQVDPVHVWQAENRFRLSLVFALIVMSSALTFRGVRILFSNTVMRFLAAISYNLYIWHQWIAVKFKEWRIPYWSGETPPNMTGDRTWQWTYTALIMIAAFSAAILATYLVEKPLAKRILKPRTANVREPMISVWREELPNTGNDETQDRKDTDKQSDE
jgi:peptidoglycan/LPS O-acetylase OafA/YrhL